MTAKVNGTTISLTRGDTLKLKVNIFNPDGSEYVPLEGDEIRFAMKQSYSAKDLKLYKTIPIDTLLLEIDPTDTKDLKQPAEYVYDIQLTHVSGDVDTFIANAKFKITEEVD